MYHLRDGFFFERRDNGDIVIQVEFINGGPYKEVAVPANEFASAIASVSRRGETGETFREAEEFLTK